MILCSWADLSLPLLGAAPTLPFVQPALLHQPAAGHWGRSDDSRLGERRVRTIPGRARDVEMSQGGLM